ncbi:Ger(x)C family spore germination protein [Clostridium folliculivorans]|uniref:Ger(x)C family spore germination protein n=1 Tax=Clostridium folliculivorans TaxID=2886038 RepID=UPI0021C443FF|nr:Ger(x)C family spore germination protein [Clostridium folliculivorans]GKU28556.1 germination protein [Clostridium folliculivorans]
MKKFILVLIVIFAFLVGVPTNYKDLDKMLLVTSIIIDVDDEGTYNIFLEGFSPTTSTSGIKQEGQRTIINVKEKDTSEIINKISSQSNLTINYTHNRVILFTKKAATRGIDEMMDLFVSAEEFVIRNYVGIWDSNLETIDDIKLNGEKFFGLYLVAQLNNSHTMASNNFNTTIRRLYNDSSIGSKTTILPVIRTKRTSAGDSLDIKCNAILKDFKYVGEIASKDIITTNMMMNEAKSAAISSRNPDITDKTIGLRMTRCKTKTDYGYKDGIFIIKKHLNVHAIYRGAQGKIKITDENIKQIEKDAEENINFNCYKIFNEYKDKNIDLIKAKENFYRRFPAESKKNNDILKNTRLDVETKVKIDFSSDPKNITF